MAAKTDLTFDELNTALGATVFTSAGSDITLSVSALTGDTYAALTDEGVSRCSIKLEVLAVQHKKQLTKL